MGFAMSASSFLGVGSRPPNFVPEATTKAINYELLANNSSDGPGQRFRDRVRGFARRTTHTHERLDFRIRLGAASGTCHVCQRGVASGAGHRLLARRTLRPARGLEWRTFAGRRL